jgi:hypothetical protein
MPETERLVINKDRGIWLSERVVAFALEQAGEQAKK